MVPTAPTLLTDNSTTHPRRHIGRPLGGEAANGERRSCCFGNALNRQPIA